MDFPITKLANVEGAEEALEEVGSRAGLPIGFMYFSIEPTVPTGKLPAFGALYNRSLYADLWEYAQDNNLVISETEWQAQASANNGNCAYYSDGDGATTFRVPSIKCWVKGADGEEVGSYLKAGLPNINGRIGRSSDSSAGTNFLSDSTALETDGVFGVEYATVNSISNGDSGTRPTAITFDASKSNAIYGNSDTVQPPSLVGMWLIVAYGTISNVGNVDLENAMSEFNRAYVDVSVDGQEITLSKADGTTKKITTQDTVPTSAYKIPYATSSTKYSTGAKVATITNGADFVLEAGALVAIRFSAGSYNSTSTDVTWSTLNVNSTGAKPIKTFSLVSSSSNTVAIAQSYATYLFVYDGTNWNMVTPNYYNFYSGD